MNNDPIVQEVRRIRMEIEQQYPDKDSYFKHLQEQQVACKQRLVKRSPQRLTRSQAS